MGGRLQTRWRQLGLYAVALWLANYAVSYWLARNAEAWWPELWPAIFAVAAVLVAAFACWPAYGPLYKAAGVAGLVALGSRPIDLVLDAMADGLTVRDFRAWAALWSYVALSGAWAWWWTRPVAGWHQLHRYGLGDEAS